MYKIPLNSNKEDDITIPIYSAILEELNFANEFEGFPKIQQNFALETTKYKLSLKNTVILRANIP